MPIRHLHQTFPAAAQDYFSMNRVRFATAAIFANVMPFDRKEHLRGSLQLCRQLLSRGDNVIVLFPEGTRTTTGELGEFRPGIGSLLAGTDVPVVPCALQGPFRAWPKGAWIPRPRRVRLIIGKPRRYSDRTPGRESSDRIARELHDVVKELLCK
jgi:1-acyl-sn-glycerol-3-phosphate acyltransferase